MSEKDKEIATEIAKILPIKEIYCDAIHPSAQSFGILASDIIKTIMLAGAPIQYLAALQDRYRNFLDVSVRRVPEGRRVPPPPQILGQVLEGIRYEPEQTPVYEMFSALLSSSMDEERTHTAHPSFPSIIRQLTPDEAKIIDYLARGDGEMLSSVEYDKSEKFDNEKVFISGNAYQNIEFANNLEVYAHHLATLGILSAEDGKRELFDACFASGRYDHLDPLGFRRSTTLLAAYALTPFGENFVAACLPSR